MTKPLSPPSHGDISKKDDAALEKEAASHLGKHAPVQLACELYTKLREMSLPWWTPKHLRTSYGAAERMTWYADRPDLRQQITTQLTGLAPRAARRKGPEFQAALLDSVIDDGDITVEAFELAFEPADLAVYGPVADFWKLFRKQMPWDDDATPHQDLVGWLIGALLVEKNLLDGHPRKPILTPWDVRTAISGRVWHTRIPLDVRVKIDEARFKLQKDRATEAFHAGHDLAIATPALIAASTPLKDLTGVLDVAGRALGFETAPDVARSDEPPAASGAEKAADKLAEAAKPAEKLADKTAEAAKSAPATKDEKKIEPSAGSRPEGEKPKVEPAKPEKDDKSLRVDPSSAKPAEPPTSVRSSPGAPAASSPAEAAVTRPSTAPMPLPTPGALAATSTSFGTSTKSVPPPPPGPKTIPPSPPVPTLTTASAGGATASSSATARSFGSTDRASTPPLAPNPGGGGHPRHVSSPPPDISVGPDVPLAFNPDEEDEMDRTNPLGISVEELDLALSKGTLPLQSQMSKKPKGK